MVVWLTPHAAVVWLIPHAAIMPNRGRGINSWRLYGSCQIHFKADGKVLFGLARSPEALSEICDVVLRVLAASVVHSVHLNRWSPQAER
jgi:hypothetical protein